MCKHNELKFIGVQKSLSGEPMFSLFNCQHCQSTISVVHPQESDSQQLEVRPPLRFKEGVIAYSL